MWSSKLASVTKETPNMTTPLLVTYLKDKGVKYAGAPINKTMLLAAQSLTSIMTDAANKCLTSVMREYGRDVWSSGYNKISRVIQIVNKQVALWAMPEGSLSVQFVFEYVLEYSLMSLRRKNASPKFFNSTNIENGENGGWTAATCVKAFLANNIMNIARSAADKEKEISTDSSAPTPKQDILEVMSKVWRPLVFNDTLPKYVKEEAQDVDDTTAGVNVETGSQADDQDLEEADDLEAVSGHLPKSGKLAVELLRDLFDAEFEASVKKLVNERDPARALLECQDAKNSLSAGQTHQQSR